MSVCLSLVRFGNGFGDSYGRTGGDAEMLDEVRKSKQKADKT